MITVTVLKLLKKSSTVITNKEISKLLF
ncbi:Protein CBG25160 [Caenorhabditis briggsae]|uniref:Protein CBG25160 n=1 Tax=Caenorhabditis briggsae TaxID=6238 RepID=B6IID3_CAEBR|nr:Protein CBG25160 [Caenorhabditis briggsae]CAR99663.1 Protein CBG25160 [Caenorhabditis briggsae]